MATCSTIVGNRYRVRSRQIVPDLFIQHICILDLQGRSVIVAELMKDLATRY
ncbi:hypothetical protein LY56_02443 [Roseinatronobacter thiooxidans]|uniref:Uncharacterized protein n=1 Tax=Roseinatronobacter thiooxidans TaxID=121821 RepID=A0A2W7Q582_9RHOB|nr:hypothetical protein LY56_02443 [Roseinatronobacter thiooxidans]